MLVAIIIIAYCWSSLVFGASLNDTGKINDVAVSKVVSVTSENDIVKTVLEAHKAHLPVSIMAVQHSQGGQTLAHGGIVLNMLPYNQVIAFDLKKKQITVESGMTWDDLQHYINPYNLAVKVMQDSYIFSIGGSLSADVHGEDFRASPIDNTIIAFHLILADGKKVLVTPTVNPQLWQAVIGGYGSLGVISDVTLQLTDNDLLQGHYHATNINDFVEYFQHNILLDPNTIFFYGRLDISPGSNFLNEMYTITSTDTHVLPQKLAPLNNPEQFDFAFTSLFNWSRHNAWGKSVRWSLEKQIIKEKYGSSLLARNTIMRKAIRFATDHQQQNHADWLQEYFIPVEQLPDFITVLRDVAQKNNINLLNVTIRYVPQNTHILLSYTKTNCFSIVLYFDQELSSRAIEQSKLWTQQLISAAIANGGSYYLTYQDFATQQQFESAYPNYKKIEQIKHTYDPDGVFTNKFYQHYFN